MMSEKEIAIVEAILEQEKPKHCLEWGSGNSTVHFANKLPSSSIWLSIEHNGNYVKYLADKLPDNATVIWVPENEWYVDCVKHSRIFDFIFLDGLQRERCLEVALDIISENGTILLHDAGRQDYQGFIKKYKGEMLCEGEKPINGYFAHRGLVRFRKN